MSDTPARKEVESKPEPTGDTEPPPPRAKKATEPLCGATGRAHRYVGTPSRCGNCGRPEAGS